ncbi:ubiquitin-40S ribosomal protein S27a isoform X1 [Peromyscus californicus insignis]|uniref:ubiquitin-40S ribosomal protein S27a isoform X1 n=1 Tax=Peromyscus californicus insignis TaxID=564181 RepID=UPI0022A6F90B|nr:ubiquitin-40S ribosomal protein S27a isoform X1 [Peromyscus californicus insignis]
MRRTKMRKRASRNGAPELVWHCVSQPRFGCSAQARAWTPKGRVLRPGSPVGPRGSSFPIRHLWWGRRQDADFREDPYGENHHARGRAGGVRAKARPRPQCRLSCAWLLTGASVRLSVPKVRACPFRVAEGRDAAGSAARRPGSSAWHGGRRSPGSGDGVGLYNSREAVH